MSHTYQAQDDATEELDDIEFERMRADTHTHLLSLSTISGSEEGAAAIALNIYRLNFGGRDPPLFAEWIGALRQGHFWHAEYARANLAWNMLLVWFYLRGRGGRGLGDDVEGDYVDNNNNNNEGEHQVGKTGEDEAIRILWRTLLRMERVEKRNLVTLIPFPMEHPSSLLSWYPNENEHLRPYFKPGDEGSHLHESTFYRELVLRDFVAGTWGKVVRAERRRVDSLRRLVDDLSEHSDSEFVERDESLPADQRFWRFEEVEEGDGGEKVVILGEEAKEGEGKGRYRLRKRKGKETVPEIDKKKEKKGRK